MTNQELEAALKNLAARYFGTPRSIGDMLDNRLTPAQLRLPHCFSLSEVVEHNPALRDLVTVQGKAPTTTVLTTATGAFCPALFNDALQRLPLWLLSSPHLSGEEVFELTALQPTVIKHAPFGGYPETYLAWTHAHYSVMFDLAQTGELLDQAYDDDALLIGFAGGDTFGVKLITGLRDIYCTLQCAKVCGDDVSAPDELDAAWENGYEELPVDIEFCEKHGPMDIGVGQHGEIAYVARVRQVNDASRLVPTRDIIYTALHDASAKSLDMRALLAAHPDNAVHCPIVTIATGRAVPSLIPEICQHLPLLAVFLPAFMAEECQTLIGSDFVPVNVLSDDPPSASTHYTFCGRSHELLLERSPMSATIRSAVDCGELILVFFCRDGAWVRYFQIDSDWWILDATTVCASGAGSIESALMQTREESSFTNNFNARRRIDWYPRIANARI